MADKLFTLHIVILNHPAALPDAAEQPLVTGGSGSRGDFRPKPEAQKLNVTAPVAVVRRRPCAANSGPH